MKTRRFSCDRSCRKEKTNEQIKEAEESVRAMRIARKSMNRFISSFEVGLSAEAGESE